MTMIKCFNKNKGKVRQGFRYDTSTKLFAAYMRMLGGNQAYETFKANTTHSVPSLRQIDRYISAVKYTPVEGVLRTDELERYLDNQHLPNMFIYLKMLPESWEEHSTIQLRIRSLVLFCRCTTRLGCPSQCSIKLGPRPKLKDVSMILKQKKKEQRLRT